MAHLRKILFASIIVGYSTLSSGASPNSKTQIPSCPAPVTGLYINDDHGYVFTVPPGLQGQWQSPCSDEPDGQCICLGSHGLSMPLPRGGVLGVYSSYTTWLDDPTVADLLRAELWRFGGDPVPDDLRIIEVQKTKVMGEEAFWVLGTYTGSDGKAYRKGIYIVFLQKSVEILIHLRAPESAYAQSLPLLNAVIKSLRPPSDKELRRMRGE